MPKLWNETIETHRRAVHDAVLDAAAELVAEDGLRAVTMSDIAERAGIGRATLYKYFPDAEAILLAWHERQVTAHLRYLAEVRDLAAGPGQRLKAVLEAYGRLSHDHNEVELSAFLHRGQHVSRAHAELTGLLCDLLHEGQEAGEVRDDVPDSELADYCIHAMSATGGLQSEAAVDRRVMVTLAGLRPLQ